MESNVFLLVVFAAILHAIWNGMVKNFGDKVISVSAIVFGHVPMAIIVMLFLPLPTLESVPYIILSAIIHQGYQYNLISAYKIGDLTRVYPIARGTGPIVATLISIIFLGLLITKYQTLSIVLICFGIIILGLFSKSSVKNNKDSSKDEQITQLTDTITKLKTQSKMDILTSENKLLKKKE